jgi:hypothetical protein
LKLQNGTITDHGFEFRHLTIPITQDELFLAKKSAAITIDETQSHLSVVKSRIRQEISSFPETEEIELYRLAFRYIDEVLQRARDELFRGDLKVCEQFIRLGKSRITNVEKKINRLSGK